MPDSDNRTGRDFSLYDAMDDAQLRQILRRDASNTEGEDTDMELMLHIMEVLAKRRKESGESIPPEQALERFNEKYKYKDNSLISENAPAKRKGAARWQRWAAAAAAMLILLLGTSLTAQAFGCDLFEIIAQWTKETFHLGTYGDPGNVDEPSPDGKNPYASLQDALDKHKVAYPLVPTWIPEGYIEESVEIRESPKQRVFTARYNYNDNVLWVRIADYLNGYPMQIEQSEDLIEKYTLEGVDYYIFKNHEQLRAVWVRERYECYIIGDFDLSEMKKIIDSIGKG